MHRIRLVVDRNANRGGRDDSIRCIQSRNAVGCGNSSKGQARGVVDGNPLALEALLESDGLDFAHDIYGIQAKMDRRTGKLAAFFSPRYSAIYHLERT